MVGTTNDIFSAQGNLAGGAFEPGAGHTRYKRMISILSNHFQRWTLRGFTAPGEKQHSHGKYEIPILPVGQASKFETNVICQHSLSAPANC
jgi:hypothetical protein